MRRGGSGESKKEQLNGKLELEWPQTILDCGNFHINRLRMVVLMRNTCNACLLLAATVAFAACGPNEQRRAELAEEKRIHCLDHICDGDKLPKHSPNVQLFKRNGQWFTVPAEYGNPDAAMMAFYWPSKTPLTGRADRQSYPEQGLSFYEKL